LNTINLALEFLLEQIQSKSITLENTLDIIQDMKISCAIATTTMNDLLLFDKIKSDMLKLEKNYIVAWYFIYDCMKSAKFQVYCYETIPFFLKKNIRIV
jgi:hypothetical protein